jgi:hypothetical protein
MLICVVDNTFSIYAIDLSNSLYATKITYKGYNIIDNFESLEVSDIKDRILKLVKERKFYWYLCHMIKCLVK